MRILLVGSFQFPMYAPAFKIGFRALGNVVTCIDYDDYLIRNGVIGRIHDLIQNKIHWGPKVSSYNKAIVCKVEEFNPEIVFLYRCYNVRPSTIKEIKRKGAFVFTYNNDDPFSEKLNNWFHRYFHRSIFIADFNFVYRKKNLIDYKKRGINNVDVLLPYYLEKQNFYKDILDTLPIVFAGHFENDGRDRYIKALIEANLPVVVYNGSYWEKAPLFEQIKQVIRPGVRGAEYNDTLNRSQIALVFLSKLNSDTYTRRCFEIPATKTLMLSEYTEDLDGLFPENNCAVYFKNEEELVLKCKWLLENPSEINRISTNGYKQLKRIGGSEVDRCRQIIETYKNEKI